VVTARISGARTAPELSLAGQALPFEPLGAEAFEIEIIPAEGGTLSIESGNDVLGTWQIDLTPDDAPTLSFVDPPSETARWAVRVAWQAVDEYGVTAVRLHLALADDAPVALDRIDETIILSQPLRPVTEADGVAFEDLTPHPWAGLPVTAWLEADDGAGQSGRSELVDLILPEREFVHPVAQAIVDQRRRLLHDPGDYEFVAEVLQDLSIRPNRFGQDIVVFMALRTAARRLQWAGDPISAVEPVAALLWETALRLEDGDLSLAFDRLRRVQDALQEALDSGASDAEIARLMDELRQAMDDYLAALQQDFQERMAAGDLGELQPVNPEQMIDQSQLDAMMDRIEELGQMGAHDEASELLEQLQQMMENLQPGAQMAQPGQQSEGLEMLEDLQALTQAQQALLDRTFQQATQTPRGDPQNRQFSDEAGQVQDALRRQLGDTMRRLGEMTGDIPGELGRAELSMRDAERALEQGEPRRATGPQTEALDQLQQGLQSFAEQLMEQMAQQGQGVQPGQILPQRRAGDDPLGRRVEGDGGTSGEGTELPPDTAVERARTILDELRRRAGERARPQDELDYIDRLLRRF
jgi:tetratricopeptide (TPR) repeat protein